MHLYAYVRLCVCLGLRVCSVCVTSVCRLRGLESEKVSNEKLSLFELSLPQSLHECVCMCVLCVCVCLPLYMCRCVGA